MSPLLLEKLRRRARALRVQRRVRQWEYRQRDLAAGVWFRLRRVLADARDAFQISDEDAQRLLSEGYTVEACGGQISPAKIILFVDEERLDTLESRRAIPVRLGPEFLAASAVALVPFHPGRRYPSPSSWSGQG